MHLASLRVQHAVKSSQLDSAHYGCYVSDLVIVLSLVQEKNQIFYDILAEGLA